MKKISLFLALIISSFCFAQKDFEGTIEYEMTYEDMVEEMEAQAAMLPKSMKIEIQNDKSRLTQPGAMGGNTVVLSDSKSGESIVLMQLMGQKFAIRSNKEDKKEQQKETAEKTDIEYVDEEKEIAGYKCKKAIVKANDGSETIIYYTEELPNMEVSDQAEGIKGFPMEIRVTNDMFTMTTIVKEIKEEKVDPIELKVPEGYEEKTLKEFQQMFGGM